MDTNQSEPMMFDYDGPPPIEHLVLNVTRNLPVDYLIVLFGYITPLFFLITVVANIMIVLVLSRPAMCTPTNLVLLAMAVADLLTLVFPVPWYFYIYTLGNYHHYLAPAMVCNLYHYNTEILPTFFHTASIWLTLLLAAQRYVYICHPSMAKIWCTNGRVAKVIAMTFVAALLHQFPRFFEGHYETVGIPQFRETSNAIADILSSDSVSSTVSASVASSAMFEEYVPDILACRRVPADWVLRLEDVYFSSYFIFRIIFVNIGPCLVLVILNLLLYSALKRAERTRARLFLKTTAPPLMSESPCTSTVDAWKRKQSLCPAMYDAEMSTTDAAGRRYSCKPLGSARIGGSGRDANSTTFMLIVVVTVFLIVEIPLAAATAVHITENLLDVKLVSDRILNMTILLSNFFIVITYPLNFAIYCGMSRAFRQTFQHLFVRRWNSTATPLLGSGGRKPTNGNSVSTSAIPTRRARANSAQLGGLTATTPIQHLNSINSANRNGVKGHPNSDNHNNNNSIVNNTNSVSSTSTNIAATTVVVATPTQMGGPERPTVEIVAKVSHLESMV